MSTSIEWCDETWNPTRGCSRVSDGCTNCYAMKMAHRFSGPGGAYEGLTRNTSHGVDWTGVVRLVPEPLDAPLRWRRPMRIFVNSMSDLFHESLSFPDIVAVYAIMAQTTRHTYQVLTKRPRRRLDFIEWLKSKGGRNHTGLGLIWPFPNVWEGVSVENEETAETRIPYLLNTPASVRFVSYEPALEEVDFSRYLPGNCSSCGDENDEHGGCAQCEWITDSPGIDWLIVGGESGPGARSFDVSWARSAVEQCKAAGVACFVKQLGARPIDKRWQEGAISFSEGPRLKSKKGGDPSEWPEDLRVREFPGVRP